MKAQPLLIETFYSVIGRWDRVDGEWVFEEGNYTDITFSINNNVIRADDRANSVYFISSVIDQEEYFLSYNAVDEKGRECVIMISDNEGVDKMAIIYVGMDLIYEYWFYL
jgi:hypothetical protein